MAGVGDSSSTDWDHLIAEYPDTLVLSVELGIMSQVEADAEVARFLEDGRDEQQRAVLRERWRQVDALEVNAQMSADEAAAVRAALVEDGNALGFGEPPW